jgi:hypothetical protein
MQKIHENIFKGLAESPGAYELVFATRNYGHELTKNEETRLEGLDLIAKADQMQMAHPYWAERKMGLFVPVITALEDAEFGM